MPPVTRGTPETVRELLAQIVDYAGLFPPAELSMEQAVRNYAGYRAGPHSWMLGRFVVPVARLNEFDAAAPDVLPRGEGSQPWRLSALIADSIRADADRMLRFNCSHWPGSDIGHAVIDVVELRVRNPADIPPARSDIPRFFEAFFEFPLTHDPAPYVQAVAASGANAGAKARTGGITADAFPSVTELGRFLESCVQSRVRFKVTAGLHHPVRGAYPLTYETASTIGAMFGYLNVFVAVAVLTAGGSLEDATEILGETALDSFEFGDDGMRWRGRVISAQHLREARRLATAFGSCSFTEPIEELAAAGVLG